MVTINLLNPFLTSSLPMGAPPAAVQTHESSSSPITSAALSIFRPERGDTAVTNLYRITDRNFAACRDVIARYSAFKCGDTEAVSFFGSRLAWKIISTYGREI